MTKKQARLPRVKTNHPTVEEQQAIHDAHSRLVSSAHLEGIVLLKTEAAFHPERTTGDIDLSLSVLPPEYRFSLVDNETILLCGCRLTALLTPQDGPVESARSIVEVHGEYLLRYQIPEGLGCPEAAFLMFAGRTGVFNAWPFFRELVHSYGTRVDMPSIVLPLFRMPPDPRPSRELRSPAPLSRPKKAPKRR